jgi:hypothetical protein
VSRIRASRTTTRVLAAALLAVFALQVPASAAAAPHELLPDLRMEIPTQLTLERAVGHYYLRFSAMISNVGNGPLEVRSTRRCPTCPHMNVSQAVLRSDGTWNVQKTRTKQRYDNSDGHHHWHVMGMERYEIFPMNAPFANGPLTGHKRGFCFFDGFVRNPSLAHFQPSPQYSYFGCGTPTSQALLVGLSVGWGDLYPYDFSGQYVDLAGVAPGDYLVCLTADPLNWFRETHNGNNASWAKVHIPAATDLPDDHRTPITAIRQGQTSCKSQLPYKPAPVRAAPKHAAGASAARVSGAKRTGTVSPLVSASATSLGAGAGMSGSGGPLVWVPGVSARESAGFYGSAAPQFGCTIGGHATSSG